MCFGTVMLILNSLAFSCAHCSQMLVFLKAVHSFNFIKHSLKGGFYIEPYSISRS